MPFQQADISLIRFLSGLLVLFLAFGCGDKPSPTKPAAGPAPRKEAGPPPAAPPAAPSAPTQPAPGAPPASAESAPAPETDKPAEAKAPAYTYDPKGRRDPFRSILVTSETVKKFERLLPLQRVEIAEMKLIGIVWGNLGSAAMVETPDGKGYTIRKGTLLGPRNGVVKKITEKNVTVLEEYTDIFGDQKMREVVMELYPQKEGTE